MPTAVERDKLQLLRVLCGPRKIIFEFNRCTLGEFVEAVGQCRTAGRFPFFNGR